jgi:hypothetical protein
MKKWLITYVFIVCSICLHTAVFANPARTRPTATTIKSAHKTPSRVLTFEKADLSLTDHQAERNGDIFFQPRNLRVPYSVVFYFNAELIFPLTIPRHVPGGPIKKNEVERALKDYLLHLYPSHYFW